MENAHDVMTLKEAAKYLRLSEMTLLRLAQRGLIAGGKIGKQWRFTRENIESLLAKGASNALEVRI